VSKYQIPY